MGQNQPLELSEDEKRDLSFQLLVEFSFSALRSLIDAAGPDRTVALNRPYWHHAGNAAGIILKNSMGLKERDPGSVISAFAFVFHVTRMKYEVFEILGTDWKEIHMLSCPFETAPPEFCQLLDGPIANGMIEAFDLNQKVVVYQRKTQGAPFCVMRIVQEGSSQKRPEGQERVTAWPQATGISREEADSWVVQYIAEHWVMITRAMMDFEGSEAALRTQLMSMKGLGLSLGLRFQGPSPRHEGEVERIAPLLEFSNQLFHQEGRLKIASPDHAEREILSCPFQSAPPALCLQYEAFFNGVCEAINPSYEFVYDRMMTKGDKTCHWTIRKKRGILESKEEPSEGQIAESALGILKKRFARGEISKDEYREQRDVLLEK